MATAISILMPIRNGERWLAPAIDSLLAQDFRNFELVIVDDGSSDSTLSILEQYKANDNRVRIFRQSPRGIAVALNLGLANSTAPLIARLDADDIAHPSRLYLQKKFLDDAPAFGLVGSWAKKIDEDGNRIGKISPATENDELVLALRKNNPFIHSSVMFRTELVRSVGGYRPFFEAAEDYDLWLRISSVAKVCNISQSLIQYRWHSQNTTQRRRLKQAFSARMARNIAVIRETTGREPGEITGSAPDWWSPTALSSFYSADARIYRLLSFAERRVFNRPEAHEAVGVPEGISLNRIERKFLRLALINIAKSSNPFERLSFGEFIKASFKVGPFAGVYLLMQAFLNWIINIR